MIFPPETKEILPGNRIVLALSLSNISLICPWILIFDKKIHVAYMKSVKIVQICTTKSLGLEELFYPFAEA